MEKIFISNKENIKISVIVEKPDNPIGLVFLMHGLGANKEKPHILRLSKIFFENGYTVIRFDTTNSFCGESDGSYEDATVTNYYSDLEDVINWAKLQEFYLEPFVLSGSSLGGMCTVIYAENNPRDIKYLVTIAPVISGQMSIDNSPKDNIENWKTTGWLTRESESHPGLIKRLKWSHMEDRLKYDLLKEAKVLNMPVLLIVGELDKSCPVEHQKILFSAIPSNKKELHIISGAPHTFMDEVHLSELGEVVDKWINEID